MILDIKSIVSKNNEFFSSNRNTVNVEQIAKSVFQSIESKRGKEQYKVMNLPYQNKQDLGSIFSITERNQGFDILVNIGIGGSSLGTRMIYEAVGRKVGKVKCLFIGESLDPQAVLETLSNIDPVTSLFNVFSKSGDTLETNVAFQVVLELLEKTLGEDKWKHLVFTLGKSEGYLYELAQAKSIPIIHMSQEISGRFSILSNAGLFSALYMGVDVHKILEGAKNLDEEVVQDRENNQVLLLAQEIYRAELSGKTIHSLMIYTHALETFGAWWQQLWAESLGKKLKEQETGVGSMPVVFTGPRDQHSLLQLFMEGPKDKTFIFLDFMKTAQDLTVKSNHPGMPYINNKSLFDITKAEMFATRDALDAVGHPTVTISLEELEEKNIGKLIYFFELLVIYLAEFYQINPFNQPGVENGKKRAVEILSKQK